MPEPVAADWLFVGLDGRELSVAGAAWRVEVYGVFDEPHRRWVQISLDGHDKTVLTLKLTPNHHAIDAVRELSAWLADPSTSDSVRQHVA